MQLPNTPEDGEETAVTDAAVSAFEGEGRHRIRLTASHARAALMAVDRAVSAGGGAVRRLYLTSVGDRSIADVTVAEVSAPAARRIGDAIAASVGVETVTVEHLWGRL